MNKAKIKLMFVIAVLGLKGFSQESAKQIKRSEQIWIGYYNSIILNPKWSANTDFQHRTNNWLSRPYQDLVRTGITYKWNDKFSISLGGAHFRYYLTEVATSGEWRPWQELSINDAYKKLIITQRFRIEERFNQKTDKYHATDGYNFSWRFRYKFDLQYPIAAFKAKKVYVTIGNEIMINAGKHIVYNYFDQDRASAGLLVDLNAQFSLQPQFVYIWQQGPDGVTLNKISAIRFNLIHKIHA